MSIYSSDYRERTQEMRKAREQQAREYALNAAATLAQNDSTGFYGHNTQTRAETTVSVAEVFLSFLTPPEDETPPARDIQGVPL